MASPPFPILPQRKLTELGDRIALCRRAREMTQKEMAFQAGVGVSTIAALEAGQQGVAIGTLARVLDVLGLLSEIDNLLRPQNDPKLIAQAIRRLPSRAP